MQSHQIGTLSEQVINAIQSRQLGVLQSSVTSENIEAADKYGYTALAHAIIKGDIPTMAWLIQKGANRHFVTLNQSGPLELAAQVPPYQACLEKIKYLINEGCSVNQGIDTGHSPLFRLIAYDNVLVAKYFLENYPHMIDHTDNYGRTLLQAAAFHGRLKLFEFLIDKHIQIINIARKDGRTALYDAIHYCVLFPKDNCQQHHTIIKILIAKGASISPEIAKLASSDPKLKYLISTLIGSNRFNNLLCKASPNFTKDKQSYPLFIIQVSLSKEKNKPYQLSVKKQLSAETQPETRYRGNISPNVPISLTDELSDVSMKVQSNGTLLIENLADNINYIIKNTGDIHTNNQLIKAQNANVKLICKSFSNKKGKISVNSFDVECKSNLNNYHGEIVSSKINALTVDGILNLHGQIIALKEDIKIRSQLKKDKKNSLIKTLNGGCIIAEKGKLIIDADNIITDDESRVWGLKGVELNTNKLQQESTLVGENINLTIAEKSDIQAGLVADEIVIEKKKGKFAVTHPIIADKSRKLKLPNPSSLMHSPKSLQSESDLELQFEEGGDLNKPLYNYAAVRINLSSTATVPLNINNHIITKIKKSKIGNPLLKKCDINISTPVALKFGNKKNLIQVRALTGSVYFKASEINIPFSAITSKYMTIMQTKGEVVVGDIKEPTKTSDLRSEGRICIYAGPKVKTYYTHFEVGESLTVSAKEEWDDVANQIFVKGIANLGMPKSTHRILTESTVQNGNLTCLGNIHGVRSNIITRVKAKSVPPFFIAGELKTTGITEVFGGSFTFAKQTAGAPPVLTHFIETISETGELLGGHKKHPWWQGYSFQSQGSTYAASSSLGKSEYKQTQLALPGNYRANELLISGFDSLLIGDLANTRLSSVKPFRQIIDVLDESNIPNSSLRSGINSPYSVFTDILELSPKIPTLPRVIIQSNGIEMVVEQKALFPLSVEQKKVALTFIKNIGQLPPEFDFQSLDFERLHAELLQNTLAFFGLRDQANQPSVALIKHQLSLEKITKTLLVYQEVDYPQKDGTIVRAVKPVLVFPKSYEKYSLTSGSSLIANILKLIGNENSRLHITGKVHGNKLVDVDVSDCLVETRLYTEQRLISQNTSIRKYGKKKTNRSEQMVAISEVREPASLTSDGILNIKADKMVQRGSRVAGNEGLAVIKQYVAEPILVSHVVPYGDQGKICGGIVNKTKVWGEVLHSSVVPSSINFGTAMKLRAERGEFSAYHAMSVIGNVDMAFTQGIKLKTVVLSQPTIPTITKSGRT